jgi:PAS domain S-box-containing protein
MEFHALSTLRDVLPTPEAENFFSLIVENLPDMVFVKEAIDLRFVMFNRAGEELLGYWRKDLIGKNDFDFFPEQEANFFTIRDRAVLASGQVLDIPEEPIHTRYRGIRILHTKKIPIYGSDGKPKYLLGISEDITDKKKNPGS